MAEPFKTPKTADPQSPQQALLSPFARQNRELHALSQQPRTLARRRLCDGTKKTEAKEGTPAQKAMSEEEIDDLVPLTPAQKLGVGMNLTAWAAGLSLAAARRRADIIKEDAGASTRVEEPLVRI